MSKENISDNSQAIPSMTPAIIVLLIVAFIFVFSKMHNRINNIDSSLSSLKNSKELDDLAKKMDLLELSFNQQIALQAELYKKLGVIEKQYKKSTSLVETVEEYKESFALLNQKSKELEQSLKMVSQNSVDTMYKKVQGTQHQTNERINLISEEQEGIHKKIVTLKSTLAVIKGDISKELNIVKSEIENSFQPTDQSSIKSDNRTFNAIFWIVGLGIIHLMVLSLVLKENLKWTWWSLCISGFIVYGGYIFLSLFDFLYIPGYLDDIFVLVTSIIYAIGLGLTYKHFDTKRHSLA